MKKFLFFIAIGFSLTAFSQEAQITWKSDLNESMHIAQSQNKNILIYFTKDDCKPCQEFYNNFFKSDAFEKSANNFVMLKVNGSNQVDANTDMDAMRQSRLVIHYNKSSQFPSVVAIDENGTILGESFNAVDSESVNTFLAHLETLK